MILSNAPASLHHSHCGVCNFSFQNTDPQHIMWLTGYILQNDPWRLLHADISQFQYEIGLCMTCIYSLEVTRNLFFDNTTQRCYIKLRGRFMFAPTRKVMFRFSTKRGLPQSIFNALNDRIVIKKFLVKCNLSLLYEETDEKVIAVI